MAEDQPTINLKILSPSPEVDGGVSFPGLSSSTTIKELRTRIRDAVPSKPAPERMRLIYRGRVVANDADTLLHVFGADGLRESKDQSLHLVLRELPPSASTPPNPLRSAQAPTPPGLPASPPLQTNPFRSIPIPRPHSQPQISPAAAAAAAHHHHHHHHHHAHHHGHPHDLHGTVPTALEQHLRQTVANSHQHGRGVPAPAHGAQTPPPVPGQIPLPGLDQANLPRQGGRTVRQEGIGPNGERWSVTINESNVTIPNLPARLQQQPLIPRPFPLPPSFGLPPRPAGSPSPTDVIDRLLPRIRSILQSARQEMDNVRALLQIPGDQSSQLAPQSPSISPPSWRVDRIREHIQTMTQNLDLVERGLAVIVADASMAQNADVVELRQTANELRNHAEEMNRRLANEQGGTAQRAPSAPGVSSSVPIEPFAPTPLIPRSAQAHTRNTAATMPDQAPPELFILSSPQGPVGVVFDQRGTYTTAPMVQTLAFHTFTNQFAQNRQLIAGLSQQIAQGSYQTHNQLMNAHPTPTQPPPGEQVPNQPQNQAQNQAQNHNHDQRVNANQNANPQPEQDRMLNVAGHLWLIFKLACFVYFFAGGDGLYRPIMLGIVAAAVYLAQIGIFEQHFNVVRRHFEAILPVGALAERVVAPPNVNHNNGNHNNNNQPHGQGSSSTSRGNLTPEQAAQRLLQQRRDRRFGWVRESMRTVERSFAIFVASLWPGIGERMVHAQEERVRAERVAEEERLKREEEEEKQRLAEEKQMLEEEKQMLEEERLKSKEEAAAQMTEAEQPHEATKGDAKTEGEHGKPDVSAKGKERADSSQPSTG